MAVVVLPQMSIQYAFHKKSIVLYPLDWQGVKFRGKRPKIKSMLHTFTYKYEVTKAIEY